MYKIAARRKLRWNFRGLCSVEDLWDLGVEDLDYIYKNLRTLQKSSEGESLLENRTAEDDDTEIRISIIKDIVQTKLAEAEEKKNLAKRLAEKRKLMGIKAEKEEADLRALSAEELQKKIDALG